VKERGSPAATGAAELRLDGTLQRRGGGVERRKGLERGGHQELGFRLYSELRKRCNRKKVKNTLLQMEYQGTVNILSCIYKLAAKL
jgi:hypothetical protein